jgi:hypothetical protein
MKNEMQKIDAMIAYAVIWKIFLLAGFFGGIISAVIYVLRNIAALTFGEAALILIAAIFFQALMLVVYSIIGYGAYSYFAKHRMFGLHTITVSPRSPDAMNEKDK